MKVLPKTKIIFRSVEVAYVVVDIEHVNKGSGKTRETAFTPGQVCNEFAQIVREFNKRKGHINDSSKFVPPYLYIYCINFKPSFHNKNYFMKFLFNKKDRTVYIKTMFCRPDKKRGSDDRRL